MQSDENAGERARAAFWLAASHIERDVLLHSLMDNEVDALADAIARQSPSADTVSAAERDAADYLIDRYRRLWMGEAVRDLDEAESALAAIRQRNTR